MSAKHLNFSFFLQINDCHISIFVSPKPSKICQDINYDFALATVESIRSLSVNSGKAEQN